jgi:tetratricopeptide (TPR) repeat protein
LKKIVITLVIGVIITSVMTGCTSKAYEEALSEGNKAMEEERYADAVVAYEKALSKKPNNEALINKIEEAKNKYASSMTSVISEITEQAIIAEEMVNAYSGVWDAVYTITLEKSSFAASLGVDVSEVEKYAELDYHGYVAFKGNFEDAIENAHNVYEGTGKNKELKIERDKISLRMKKFQNPPKGYKQAYESIVEVYSLYEKYIAFVLSPSGSLMSYNHKANELSSELVLEIKKLQIKIPE